MQTRYNWGTGCLLKSQNYPFGSWYKWFAWYPVIGLRGKRGRGIMWLQTVWVRREFDKWVYHSLHHVEEINGWPIRRED